MKRPIIALTADWQEPGGYSKYSWYALRENYCESIYEAGGTPLLLPYHVGSVEQYVGVVDALLITGGDFDIDPSLYGQQATNKSVKTIPHRSSFELELAKKSLDKDIPVLGICGGQQLMNVALGGSLIQDIKTEYHTDIEHEQLNPRHEVSHSVTIKPNSILHGIIGRENIMVNSAHHQAVSKIGHGLVTNANSPDGLIEGIEAPTHRFCIGVQWHPEFFATEFDRFLFEAFVEAAKDPQWQNKIA